MCGFERARAEDLAGLVTGRRDERQVLRDAGVVRGGVGDGPQRLRRWDELGQPRRVDRDGRPAPVAGLRPSQGAVVEGEEADLRRDAVDEAARQPMGQEPAEEEVPLDAPPRLGLLRAEDVRLRLGAERRDRLLDAKDPGREAERRRPSAAGPRRAGGRARRSRAGAASRRGPSRRRCRAAWSAPLRRARRGAHPAAPTARDTPRPAHASRPRRPAPRTPGGLPAS